ncbi:MAG: acyloxyacyl hydrolase, partial [Paraglaciecola chathamensis]
MRTLLIIIALLSTYLTSSNAFAAKQGIAVDYLLGSDDIQGVRLAYRPYATQLTQIKWLGDVDIYWEVSMNFWEVGADNRHETNYAVAISPVLSKQFATIANKYPLRWEFGIGVSLVEDTRFAGKDIGSHYQFE